MLADYFPTRPATSPLFGEDEEGAERDETETDRLFPVERFAQIEDREDDEDRKRDDLLDRLPLGGIEITIADAVCRDLGAIFEKGDRPAGENDKIERIVFELKVT